MRTEELTTATVVTVAGEIDLLTAPELQDRLAAAGRRAAVIADLHDVTYFDMSGVHALDAAARAIGGHGHRLILARPSRLVRRVLDLVGRDLPVEVAGGVEDALALLHGGTPRPD